MKHNREMAIKWAAAYIADSLTYEYSRTKRIAERKAKFMTSLTGNPWTVNTVENEFGRSYWTVPAE